MDAVSVTGAGRFPADFPRATRIQLILSATRTPPRSYKVSKYVEEARRAVREYACNFRGVLQTCREAPLHYEVRESHQGLY